jgi:type I restriction enzyme, S subunit
VKVQEVAAAYAALTKQSDWPRARVGDICKAVNGRAFKPTEWADKGIPIIRIQNLKKADAPFNYFAGALEEKFRVKAGDLLFAWSGTPGTSFGAHIWHGSDAALNQHIFNLHFDHARVDAKYFCYALNRNVADYVTKAQGGVGLAHITKGKFESSEIPLPPLDQQKRIVAEIEKQFSRLDEAVANLRRVKAKLKRYKAAVLKSAVEGRLVETEAELARREGRSYETGAQLLQRVLETRRSQWQGKGKYKEPAAPDTTDLPELPEGWVWARLDSIAALKGGITVDSKRQDLTARTVPYLRVANVQRGYLDLAEVKTINAPASDVEVLRLVQGDILFNEGGDRDKLGRGWIWEGQLTDCIHQNHVFRARVISSDIHPKLVSWWGNSFGKDYFQREGKQTTNLASINLTKLSAFPVPVPPHTEQQRIVAEVERCLSIVHGVESQVDDNLKRAEHMRWSALHKAFSDGV